MYLTLKIGITNTTLKKDIAAYFSNELFHTLSSFIKLILRIGNAMFATIIAHIPHILRDASKNAKAAVPLHMIINEESTDTLNPFDFFYKQSERKNVSNGSKVFVI